MLSMAGLPWYTSRVTILSSDIRYIVNPPSSPLSQNWLLASKTPLVDIPFNVTVKLLPLILSSVLILMNEARSGVQGKLTNSVAVIGGNGATATRPSVVRG